MLLNIKKLNVKKRFFVTHDTYGERLFYCDGGGRGHWYWNRHTGTPFDSECEAQKTVSKLKEVTSPYVENVIVMSSDELDIEDIIT